MTLDLQRSQCVAHDERSLQHPLEWRLWRGIEIKMQVVRTPDIVAPRIPGIQIDAAEIHHPKQRSNVLNHGKPDDVARSMFDRADGNKIWPWRGRPLHKEKSAVDSVGIALHHHGPILHVRQK